MSTKTKRFYWIKLKIDFMNGDIVDYLMSQPEGANYVVLYQMLCLMTVNSCGVMATIINEVVIPFDVDRIQRDCRYFSHDTIKVAMDLFTKLGLIYRSSNDLLTICDYNEMVGSETSKAPLMRSKRESNKLSGNNVTAMLPAPSNIVTQSKSKRIEKEIDLEKDLKNKKHEKKSSLFFNLNNYSSEKHTDIEKIKDVYQIIVKIWSPDMRGILDVSDGQYSTPAIFEQIAVKAGCDQQFVDDLEKAVYAYRCTPQWENGRIANLGNWFKAWDNYLEKYYLEADRFRRIRKIETGREWEKMRKEIEKRG